MNELKIEDYRIVDSAEERPYCIYIIEVFWNRRKYVVEKRYSQLHALHIELRGTHTTPYFPPKKVRSLQQKNIEKRKKALEAYLQTMLKLTQSRSQVLTFLGINKAEDQTETGEARRNNNQRLNHQPVFQFKKNLIPVGLAKSSIPDIVTEGALLGVYKSS